jgi:arginine deiminase
MGSVSVSSEIGALRHVIVHAPGREIEAMGPKEAEGDLYNDIIPLDIVKEEHAQLRAFLALVAKVSDVRELLAESLDSERDRWDFVKLLSDSYGLEHRIGELLDMKPERLAEAVIVGLDAKHATLESFLKKRKYDLKPLPNLYFVRDPAFVYRDTPVPSAMRFDVRHSESLISRFILTRHKDFSARGPFFDGPSLRGSDFTIEGGDVQILRKDVLAIGISERTSPKAIDAFARKAAEAFDEPITVFAVELPHERATIHLDMTFTMIDVDAAIVYAPLISGLHRCRVVRLDAFPDGSIKVEEAIGLREGLRETGMDLRFILAGGAERVFQEREQWMSGANSFAFAPGKIIMYSCNVRTLDSLAKAGFAIKKAADFIAGKESPDDYPKLVVGFDGVELARGGGGARCMTLPVERDEVR